MLINSYMLINFLNRKLLEFHQQSHIRQLDQFEQIAVKYLKTRIETLCSCCSIQIIWVRQITFFFENA